MANEVDVEYEVIEVDEINNDVQRDELIVYEVING